MSTAVRLLVLLMLAAGVVAMSFAASRAAEVEPSEPRSATHQLVICQPDMPCLRRGRPSGETACHLNGSSEKLIATLPSGTWIICMPLVRR